MKWKFVVLSLAVLFTLTACGKMTNSGQKKDTHVQTSVKESKYPGMEIETEVGEYKTYKYAIHFPRTKHEKINSSIKSFVKNERDQFISEAKKKKPQGKNYSELLLDYDITHSSKNLLTVVFSSNANLVGEQSNDSIYTLNFDRKTGKKIKLDALLKNDDASLQRLSSIAQYSLLNNSKIMAKTNPERVMEGTKAELSNYRTYGFSDHSMDIYFHQNQVGPAYKLQIALNELNGVVKDSYMKTLEQVITNDTELLSDTTGKKTEKKPYRLIPGQKYVALTFDDGPHHQWTPYILDVLKKHKAKATFFVLGNRVEYYPNIVKRAFDEGHEIGSHSWSHPKLTSLTKPELVKQINQTSTAVAKIIGQTPTSFRPPYGAYNPEVQRMANAPIVNWSVDTLDWKHKNKDLVKKIVKERTHNGSIVLMHDIHEASALALDDILTSLSKQGYHFVTVSQLLQLQGNPGNYVGEVYFNGKVS
ncbi:polysaccharide deacetylase family protein [Bacillus sp. 1P06AnD]|uniref:polysaccharide deacetylase family protein n=1 Tax=Bacillus sp. 1P06AnD TaxID=3132208 RepID=UPI0039A0FDFE